MKQFKAGDQVVRVIGFFGNIEPGYVDVVRTVDAEGNITLKNQPKSCVFDPQFFELVYAVN